MAAFTEDTVSNQKRLARGEHWLLARSLLRSEHGRHHARWSILTLAGGAPSGEINCIRALMPGAHILAVDKESSCVDAAIAAGADEAMVLDLSAWSGNGRLPEPVHQFRRKFDVINLDLCALATHETKELVQNYLRQVNSVLMLTFAYGRDVVEQFVYGGVQLRSELARARIPDRLAARISFLLPEMTNANAPQHSIRSVIAYKGASMPMCSVVVQRHRGRGWWQEEVPRVSYVQLEAGDLELAVMEATRPAPTLLYDLPEDWILALRRSVAAKKAVATRQQKELAL